MGEQIKLSLITKFDMPKCAWSVKDLHEGRIRGVHCTYKRKDGVPLVLSAGEDRNINMTNALTGEFVDKIGAFNGRPGHPGHTDKIYCIVTWTTPDDETFIITAGDECLIRIFPLEDKHFWNHDPKFMIGHTEYIHTMHVIQEKSELISASYDRSIRIWDLIKCEQIKRFNQSKQLYTMDICLKDPDLTHFATGNSKYVYVWNMEETVFFAPLEPDSAPEGTDEAAAGPGAMVASNANELEEFDDVPRVIKPRVALPPYIQLELRSHTRTVTAVAYPALDRLISASDDGQLCIWNPELPEMPLLEKIDAKSPIYSMKYFNDDTVFYLITCAWGNPYTVKIWNLEEKEKPPDDSESEEELDSDEEPEPKEIMYCYPMDIGKGHEANVVDIAILDDGKPHVVKEKRKEDEELDIKMITSISWDGCIKSWDLRPAIEVVHRAKFLEKAQTSRTF